MESLFLMGNNYEMQIAYPQSLKLPKCSSMEFHLHKSTLNTQRLQELTQGDQGFDVEFDNKRTHVS